MRASPYPALLLAVVAGLALVAVLYAVQWAVTR
jgi:hypothetical protein